MNKWLKTKLGIFQLEKEITGIYKTVNRLDIKIAKLENKTRDGRAMRYDEVNRARKRRYKKSA